MNAPAPETSSQSSTQGMNVVALTGRRIDAAGAASPRFPLDHTSLVQERIRTVLRDTKAGMLVSSAACGADLLALEAARELGLCMRVILPFAREQFRETSVVDRPGDWGVLFDRLMDTAEREGAVCQLEVGLDKHDAYIRVVDTILDVAADCANRTRKGEIADVPGIVTAAAVWDGQSRGSRDVTGAFLQGAHDRGITVRDVYTY